MTTATTRPAPRLPAPAGQTRAPAAASHDRPAAPQGLARLVAPLASLRLTVVLMVLATLLTFVGTLAQAREGLWTVLEAYFRSWLVWVPLDLFIPLSSGWQPDGSLPMPAGATLGLLLLLNLLAAHAVRFRLAPRLRERPRTLWAGAAVTLLGVAVIAAVFGYPPLTSLVSDQGLVPLFVLGTLAFMPLLWGAWLLFERRAGLVLVHVSLIVLLVGEGLTAVTAQESQMVVYTGQTSHFAFDIREHELALIDPAAGDGTERVYTVPQSRIEAAAASGRSIPLADSGFRVAVHSFHGNSRLHRVSEGGPPPFDAGIAGRERLASVEIDAATGMDIDFPSVGLTLMEGEQNLGRYLVSGHLQRPDLPHWPIRQSVEGASRPMELVLRPKRIYKPYTVELHAFHHDLYPGTDVPLNYASDVTLTDLRGVNAPADGDAGRVRRAELIRMNEPMRHRGEAFFQSGWVPDPQRAGGNLGTVLQVVDNPAWTLPYIAVIVGGLGLTLHFGLSLWKHLRDRRLQRSRAARRAQQDPPGAPVQRWRQPAVVAALAAAVVAGGVLLRPDTKTEPARPGYDLVGLASLPLVEGGRTKAVAAYARDTLSSISGVSKLERAGRDHSALHWLMEVQADTPASRSDAVFRIDHPSLKRVIGVTDNRLKRFSVEQIRPHTDYLFEQARLASEVPSNRRDAFQSSAIDLAKKIELYSNAQKLALPAEGLAEAWRDGDPAAFNASVAAAHDAAASDGGAARAAAFEAWLVGYDPFGRAMALYLVAALLVVVSWMALPRWLLPAAVVLSVAAVSLHTLGLGGRVYISGRPPVTNLYSAAAFVGWGGALLGLLCEPLLRGGVSLLVGGVSGLVTLLIAGAIGTGDTMAVLQAVLDTNFWLATHVITITLGYSAVVVAGFLGAVYLLGGVYTRAMADPKRRRGVEAGVYGVTAFALLLSFVGTILGGIWADQSWGRFWGWDPKENGALMIVLWSAVILHARWGRLLRGPGLAALAVLGNVIVAWSFLGTNILGAGLHSYGFTDNTLLTGLVLWCGVHVAIASCGLIPMRRWQSLLPPATSDRQVEPVASASAGAGPAAV